MARAIRPGREILGHSAFDLNKLAIELVKGGLREDTVNRVIGIVGDEAKATGALSCLIVHDNDIRDGAKLLKVQLEVGISDGRGEPSHKDFAGPPGPWTR